MAKYDDLELDIIPEASEGQHDKWNAQVAHLKYFEQMSPAAKDVVRLIKAWARLRVPVPGVLIETIVDNVCRNEQQTRGSAAQNLFLSCLRALSRRQNWIDQLNPMNDLRDVLKPHEWDELFNYASSTMSLVHVPRLGDIGFCLMTYPVRCQICLAFDGVPNRPPLSLGMLNGFEIAELCMRLAFPVPPRFEQYSRERTRLTSLSEAQEVCSFSVIQKVMIAEYVKNEIPAAAAEMQRQLLATEVTKWEETAEVMQASTEMDRLRSLAEMCADVRPDALDVVKMYEDSTLDSPITLLSQRRERESVFCVVAVFVAIFAICWKIVA